MAFLLPVGLTLALSICVGLVVHEAAHAAVLRLGRVEYAVTYFPGRNRGRRSAAIGRPWAVVDPVLTGREPAWVLRTAALAPLALWLPVVVAGITDVVSLEQPIVTAFSIGWLACALPSPQDFSVAFYAHRLLDGRSSHHSAVGMSTREAE